MTEIQILQSPPTFPSPSSSLTCVSSTDNDVLHQQIMGHDLNNDIDTTLINTGIACPVALYNRHTDIQEEEEDQEEEGGSGGGDQVRIQRKRREREEGDQLSVLAVLVTVFRKSLVACRSVEDQEHHKYSSSGMEIGWPTNVRHVAHVTFDRFNGFLGLPVEFEPEVPRRPPSASTRVFGVSTDSMQLSFDSRGNSVPTILLMMQSRLYAQGGLQAEGIFRINAENGQEEYVREQLNHGVVPDDIDVHCLAGLIKAWFRELPSGVLDSLSPEEVMHAQSEEECVRLVRLLPPTEAALLDWAINLMADVAQLENLNKMNARNIAMVFAPNMTQMADPLTALMYAVQVMNFLKTLIVRTLREREDSLVEACPATKLEPSDENGHDNALKPITKEAEEVEEDRETTIFERPISNSTFHASEGVLKTNSETNGFLSSIENILPDGKDHMTQNHTGEISKHVDTIKDKDEDNTVNPRSGRSQFKNRKTRNGQSSNCDLKKGSKRTNQRAPIHASGNAEKGKETSLISRLNTQTERVEAWR